MCPFYCTIFSFFIYLFIYLFLHFRLLEKKLIKLSRLVNMQFEYLFVFISEQKKIFI